VDIVYSTSDYYSEICGTSLESLLFNNTNISSLNVYIINNDISQENINRLQIIATFYKRSIYFIDKIDLKKITKTNINVGRWNIGTFYRLYLCSLLPMSVEKVIYLDCDTIIRHSLNDIYNFDLGKFSVAGVDDCRSDLYRLNVGMKESMPYINNGFLLINLKKWREEKIEQEFTEFISKYKGDITYMDQGVLNGVLSNKNEIFEIRPIYNSQRIFYDFNFNELLKLRRPTHHLDLNEYNEAINNPTVVHFTPTFISGTRPWNIKDNHKYRDEFLYYKSLTPWKDFPLRKDDRKFLKKIMTMICKLSPRKFVIFVFSYLHSVWYPKKRIKKMNKAFSKGDAYENINCK